MASNSAASGTSINDCYPFMSGLHWLEGLTNKWINAWHTLLDVLDSREFQSEKIMYQKKAVHYFQIIAKHLPTNKYYVAL